MCILFALWVRNPSPNGYHLILVANRDEYLRRPAATATPWPGAPHVFGGIDMEPGREGGTWLAMDTEEGRIAVLLNVTCTSATTCDPPRGRGFLVADWLRNNSPPSEYLKDIAPNGTDYSGFHFITFRLGPQGDVVHFSNSDDKGIRSLPEGVISLGNSPIDRPFYKVKEGRRRFQDIIDRLGNKSSEQKLIEELLTLVKCDKEHMPDPEIEILNMDDQRKKWTSALFQKHPTIGFGTRTHTIILVDADWKGQFHEWTLKEPIESQETTPWVHTTKSFVLPFGK